MTSPEPRPRVVLADDHPSVLVAFGRLLQSFCDVVGSAPSGRQAMEDVARLKPDVLVVDLMMPDLNGLEVCRRVKQTTPETDVVIVTAFDDTHVETVALQAGASAYIPKHSAANGLGPAIQRVFSKRQNSR